MPSPIDLALTSLLPHVAFPPEELQRQTASLLTQSRARAPRLKADEEVARTFACAHIACERLQQRLDLDITHDVRPPCPPRVYTRLKGFLDGLLGKAPQRQQQQQQQQQQQLPLPQTQTPRRGTSRHATGPTPEKTTGGAVLQPGSGRTATRSANPVPVTTTPTATRKRAREEEESADGVPAFATPLLRYVCAYCKVADLVVDSVRAGAAEAMKEIASRREKPAEGPPSSSKRRRGRPPAARNMTATEAPSAPQQQQQTPVIPVSRWPALLLALFLCTVAKMREQDIDGEEMGDLRGEALDGAVRYCAESELSALRDQEQSTGDLARMVSFYLLEAGDCGWLEMKWYEDIPLLKDIPDDGNEENDERKDEDGDEEDTPIKPRRRPVKTPLRRKEKHGDPGDREDSVGPAGLLPGLATMFQPAVDWLSDERKSHFTQWRRATLGEIAAIKQQA